MEPTIIYDFTITAIDERGGIKAETVFTNQDQVTVLEGVIAGIIPGIE